ncbi:hypothetical protein KAJ02_05185, partial [Candidatus Bipolaricaulota bacterium]|nr:hypothetical protein [Candidatus Bipolaricaulota bacterium]
MKKQLGVISVITLLVVTLFTLSALATDAQMYFSSDKNGQNRVTNIQEGDEIWIVVIDNDENIDCDVRDKIWTDIKIMDPKTGAYIIWKSYVDTTGSPTGKLYDDTDYVPYKGHSPGTPGDLTNDYLEETGADTGVFVSKRAFQVGTREDYDDATKHTHVVDTLPLDDFQWGHYIYADSDADTYADNRGYFGASATFTFHTGIGQFLLSDATMPSRILDFSGNAWLVGRFENMDTLIGLYQDRNDETDVAIGLMKIIDTEATIAWDQVIYKDANGSASITIVDPDENLNCNEVEWVPVFIIVNPGSWNPVDELSPTNFCMLKRTGGVNGANGTLGADRPIRWYNIYNAQKNFAGTGSTAGAADGKYYIKYDQTLFNTTSLYTPVLFYAQETGV